MAQQRQIAPAAYLVALAFILIPPFDALMQVLPFRIHDPKWRFGFFGLASNALMIPMAGLLIAFMVAIVFEHRRFQKVLGILSTVAAIAMIVALGVFALDALQVRGEVNPARALAFKVASLTAALKGILGIITFVGFSYASFRAPKLPKPAKGQRSAGLIVAAKPSTAAPAPRPAAVGIDAEPDTDPTT